MMVRMKEENFDLLNGSGIANRKKSRRNRGRIQMISEKMQALVLMLFYMLNGNVTTAMNPLFISSFSSCNFVPSSCNS